MIDRAAGLTTGDPDEAAMKRALAARAAETVVPAGSEKIGAAPPFTVLGLDRVAGIVTDAPAGHEVLQRLRDRGVTIVHADRAGLIRWRRDRRRGSPAR